MEYLLGNKKVLLRATIWMNLENMLSERSQTQKAIHCMIPFIQNVQNRQIQRDSRCGCLGLGVGLEGKWEVTANGSGVAF